MGEWINEKLQEEEEEEALPVVSLGDASIASPFTSRFNTVTPCLDLVMQVNERQHAFATLLTLFSSPLSLSSFIRSKK